MPAKKYTSHKAKHGEVSSATFDRLADGHKWFAKDHDKRAKKEKDAQVAVMHEAIATMHQEAAAVLRLEAEKLRSKP